MYVLTVQTLYSKIKFLTEATVLYTRIQFYPITYLLKSLVSRIFIFSEFLLRQFLRFRRQAAFVVIALGYPFDRAHLVTLICLQQQAVLNFRYPKYNGSVEILKNHLFLFTNDPSIVPFSILRSLIGKYTAIVTDLTIFEISLIAIFVFSETAFFCIHIFDRRAIRFFSGPLTQFPNVVQSHGMNESIVVRNNTPETLSFDRVTPRLA